VSKPGKFKVPPGPRPKCPSSRLFLLAEKRFIFLGDLFDFELPEDRMPGNVNFMPLGFNPAQPAFAGFAQKPQGGGIADQRMDFLAGGRSRVDVRKDKLNLLDNDTFDFKKMIFVGGSEFLGPGHIDEMVKLLPTFNVGLNLGYELIDFFKIHKFQEDMDEDVVWGNMKTIAPPRSSRAVRRRLAKLMVISATGICAVWASRNSSKAILPIARWSSMG
jgi:hypothetical protein